MKKNLFMLCVSVAIAAALLTISGCGSNKTLIDNTYRYDYAYIDIPGRESVEGEVESWRDYDDGDQIQVQINGKTYLSDSTRIVLVAE